MSDPIKEIVSRWPQCYHVTDRLSFEAILEHGLIPAQKLVSESSVSAQHRHELLEQRRPESVEISHPTLGRVVIRDQKPMSVEGLRRALPSHISPEQWLCMLNSRVFFWLTEERLLRFLCAKAYRNEEHLVLSLDTHSLLSRVSGQTDLSPMNSGSTKPMPHPRDESTFTPIHDYPFNKWDKVRGKKTEAAAELCVRGPVDGIGEHLLEARVMQGSEILETLF